MRWHGQPLEFRINKTGEWVRLPKFEGTVPPQFSEGLFPTIQASVTARPIK